METKVSEVEAAAITTIAALLMERGVPTNEAVVQAAANFVSARSALQAGVSVLDPSGSGFVQLVGGVLTLRRA